MSLSATRRKAAEAAIFAFIKAKGSRAPSAVALNPGTNPDLRDDLVDLIADVLIWAKAEGLDPAYIARVGASHTGIAEQTDDAVVTLLAERRGNHIRSNGRLLVHDGDGRPALVGDELIHADGQTVTLLDGFPPHQTGDSGTVKAFDADARETIECQPYRVGLTFIEA